MRHDIAHRSRLKEYDKILSKYSIPSYAKNPQVIADKQTEIVEGACKVFFKKGFSRTSMRDVATSCQMSIGQLYHYISSKDDILFLVHKHMHELWLNHLKNLGIDDMDDPGLRLERTIRGTLELIIEHRKLFQFVYTETKHLAKDHLNLVLDIDEKIVLSFWRQMLAELEMKHVSEKQIPLAASLIAFLTVFEALRGWTVQGLKPKEIVSFVTEFMLQGLGLRSNVLPVKSKRSRLSERNRPGSSLTPSRRS